jgi:hypothetical protein
MKVNTTTPEYKWRTQRWPCRVECRCSVYWAHNAAQLETLLKLLADGSRESITVASRYARR